MIYNAEIRVKHTVKDTSDSSDSLYKAFMLEKGRFTRSGFDVVKDGGDVIFKIVADDATALRATLNAITKLLSVYEKL